jgi:hypothetical protein
VKQSQQRDIVVTCVLLKTAFVVEGYGPSLEQNTSAGNARRGIAQSVARQAVVAITVRADDLHHAFEHLVSQIGLAARIPGAVAVLGNIAWFWRASLDKRQFDSDGAKFLTIVRAG